MNFARFVMVCVFSSGFFAHSASKWTVYDDDKVPASRIEFVLDQAKQCEDAKKVKSVDLGSKGTIVPANVRDIFMPVLSITTDEIRFKQVNRAFCDFAFKLKNSGCNTDDVKIVTRLKTQKLGQVNEGPNGKKYISEFMVYGCNKVPEGKVVANCTFPKKEDENLMQPMENSAYAAFISRCHDDLYALGTYSGPDVELEDSKAALDHITRDPSIASVVR